MSLDESVSSKAISASGSQRNVESSPEMKTISYKNENKVPSKGLKLTKKKQEEDDY